MKKRKVIALVLLGLGILCGAVGIMTVIVEQNAGKEYEEIKEEVTKEVQEEPADTPDEEEEPKTPVDVPVDFAALQQRNPDVYAWIQIPNTAVDYPILQSSTDNAYYLNHTIDREEKRCFAAEKSRCVCMDSDSQYGCGLSYLTKQYG